FRKKGIAKLLINKAIEIANQNNANRIQLNTGTQNMNARNLYETMGFEWFPDKEIYMYFLH
ncbi:MAG: GNAT family N-acetyltransferase, partial [Bacillota bacterium]